MKALVRKHFFWAIVAIVVMLAVNVIRDPGYLAFTLDGAGNISGNLIHILREAAPILMIAVGMSLVIATGGIDLSVGSLMAVAGAVSMQFLSGVDDRSSVGAMFAALGLSIGLTAVLGVLNGIFVTVMGLQPFVATLVMMLAGRGLAKVITDGQNTLAVNDPYNWIATGYLVYLPAVVLIAAAIAGVVGLIVRRSALGLMIEAIGINRRASRMAGIRPRGITIAVYAISGALAGVAGVFAVGGVMVVEVSQTGSLMELDAILAVVVGGASLAGGTFSLTGAAIGALLIATLDKTIIFLGISPAATPAFKAGVIILICLLQSERVRTVLRGRSRDRDLPEQTSSPHTPAQQEGVPA